MTREITSVSFRRSVFREYNNRCYVCGFSVPQVLRVHHLVPVSLGGVDTLENLVLLCSNCHALVHVFSSERFSGKNIHKLLEVEYSGEEIDRIGELAYKIRQAKHNIQRSNNLWSAKNLSSRR